MTIRIKGCVLAAAVASVLPAVASAEKVPLFKATPVSDSTFPTNFAEVFTFDESEVTVYCGGDDTATYTADVKDTNGGPPIVDNFMTAGDPLASICQGGSAIQSGGTTSGTHCFWDANYTTLGSDMRDAFNGPNVTAQVALVGGKNTLTFKLWDYGVVYGNVPLELVLPETCATAKVVNVNVHPNSDPNPLNTGSGGSTPVAIFGTDSLNVYDIDTGSLSLGDAEVKVVGKKSKELCSIEDIGSYDEAYFDNLNPTLDGNLDLLCKFNTVDVFDGAIAGENVEIKIIGTLKGYIPFEGYDLVKIVK